MEKKMQTTKPSSLASVAGNREQRVPGTNLLGTPKELPHPSKIISVFFIKKKIFKISCSYICNDFKRNIFN